MKASHTSDGLKGTIIYYKTGIEMTTKTECNTGIGGFPHLPPNRHTLNPAPMSLFFSPKHFSEYKEAGIHTALTQEQWSRSEVL